MESSKKQIAYVNYAKAIGIILMVCGHAASPFNRYIYQFHIPLFLFLSGYFYKDIFTENPIILVKKRLKTLYVPFLIYNLWFIILNPFITKFSYNFPYSYDKEFWIKSLNQIIRFKPIDSLMGSFWFLRTLFIMSILFTILSWLISKIKLKEKEYSRAIVVFFCLLIGTITLVKYNNANTEELIKVLMTMPIFYIGYLFRCNEEKIPFNWYLFLISGAIMFSNGFFPVLDIANMRYVNPASYLLSSINGIYFTICVSKCLEIVSKKIKLKWFEYIGKNTLVILAFHLVVFKLINYVYSVKTNNHSDIFFTAKGIWILYSILGIIVPVLIKYIFDIIIELIGVRKHKNIKA